MTAGQHPDHSGNGRTRPADEPAPRILGLPIGLAATTGMRREFDSLGEVEVPGDRYWGAQTQRSLQHFNIGNDRMPKEVYHAYGYVKKAAAVVNTRAGRLPAWKGQLIERVCDEVISGSLDEHFPLYVFQTGSGTQSNMNVNEVISNRCIQLVGGTLGSQQPVHPNDHVNMGQSSNDTFPTAMHIAAYTMATKKTIPALKRLRDAIERKSRQWADVVKICRTHLEDATPLTVGQEWSGYASGLDDAIAEVEHATRGLLTVAMGGTAVGTGLNAPPGFGDQVAAEIASTTGDPFETAANKFTAQGTLDRMVRAHAGLKAAAVTLFKIANDLRWLGSGPRTGIHELIFPANEPGSSIMPGKVNPTQAEAMLMVAIQVIASDVAVTMSGAEGNFELDAFRPVLINNYLHSALILADMCDRFREFMVEGTRLNEAKLKENIDRSVMMVTALSPVIGYDQAAAISYYAIDHDLTLKQAALAKGVSEELFDKVVKPLALTRPGSADVHGLRWRQLGGSHGCHADFEAMMQASMDKEVADVALRVWTPAHATVRFVKQVAPAIEDLTGRRRQSSPQAGDYPTGAWGIESRDYHVCVGVEPALVGQEMLAARISLILDTADGPKPLGQGLVRAIWTDDEGLSTRINRHIAHYTGQTELAQAIQDGLEARKAGEDDTAAARLGRAVALAHESGNEQSARLLAKVVNVMDPVTGTVRLKAKVIDADEMALDTRSSKTIRVKK